MAEITGAARAVPPTLLLKNSGNPLAAETTPSPVRLPQNPPPKVVGGYGGENAQATVLFPGFDIIPASTVSDAALEQRSNKPFEGFNLISAATVRDAALGEEPDIVSAQPALFTSSNLVSLSTIRLASIDAATADDVVAYAKGTKKLSAEAQRFCDDKPAYRGKPNQCGVDIAFNRLSASEFGKIDQLVAKDPSISPLIDTSIRRFANQFLYAHVGNDQKTDIGVAKLVASRFLKPPASPEVIQRFAEAIRTAEGREKFCKQFNFTIPKIDQATEPPADPKLLLAANTSESDEKAPDRTSSGGVEARIEAAHRDRKSRVIAALGDIETEHQRSEHAKEVAEKQAAKTEDIRDAAV